ncbi:hypothetical protein TNCV_5055171 [Trichonephila clavipes]|nr:hypothetical protein TNCV_5055171 [Trichonephila clavipes]
MQADEKHLLRSFRYIYSHQNTAHRTRTSLRLGRDCVSPISSFIIQHTQVAISLFAEISIKAKVMVIMLTVHTAANVVLPYKRILGVQQACPPPD